MCFRRVLRCCLSFFRILTRLCRCVLSKLRLRYTRKINMESDDECQYDSTWEDEQENKTPRKKVSYRHRRNEFAAEDMQNYRHSCRGLDDSDDDEDDSDGNNDCDQQDSFLNLKFYRGQINSLPDDVHIEEFHRKWWGKYKKLENVHTYIQWLFPIQEPGVNWSARVLTKKEIKSFRKNKEVKSKLVVSYELMLDFYGIRLVNESTGEVDRASNWEERFKNLNRYTHNSLRITRILKCLGTLGLKHYQAPLVKFFLDETLVKGQLPNVKQSALDYFMFAVLDKKERKELVKYAFKNFKPQKYFVWGPKKILSGHVAHCKKENIDQPTENKQSGNVEDQQKRVKPHESKLNKTDVSHPPEEMESKEAHQNVDEPETKSDQKANESSQCRSENESVAKVNDEMTEGVGDNDVSNSYKTNAKSSCENSEMTVGDDDVTIAKSSCETSDTTLGRNDEDEMNANNTPKSLGIQKPEIKQSSILEDDSTNSVNMHANNTPERLKSQEPENKQSSISEGKSKHGMNIDADNSPERLKSQELGLKQRIISEDEDTHGMDTDADNTPAGMENQKPVFQQSSISEDESIHASNIDASNTSERLKSQDPENKQRSISKDQSAHEMNIDANNSPESLKIQELGIESSILEDEDSHEMDIDANDTLAGIGSPEMRIKQNSISEDEDAHKMDVEGNNTQEGIKQSSISEEESAHEITKNADNIPAGM